MTPEERAAKIAAEILRECDRHDAEPIIAAAISEAVMAEREASARVVETFVVQGIFDLRAKLAAAIRARTP